MGVLPILIGVRNFLKVYSFQFKSEHLLISSPPGGEDKGEGDIIPSPPSPQPSPASGRGR